MKNQSGFITMDFLFAFVLVMAFSALLFALTLTLTVAEVTQYITYAAARNYVAAHQSEIQQNAQATQKFNNLVGNSVFKPLYSNNWFIIDKAPNVGHLSTTLFPAYQQPGPGDPDLFWGVGVNFTAKILDFQVPFYGSTAPDSNQGSGFKTFIASYLSREPTFDECYNFMQQRWNQIRTLTVSGGAPYSTDTTDNSAFPITDNGC
jgi:hypothetical protein